MTPAVDALEAAGIAHRVLSYEHDPSVESYGEEAADALGLDPMTVFKTLVARLDDDELVVAVVPVSSRLDLKALARSAGAKRAVMAPVDAAERVTGYVAGGISPIGQRRRLRTFVDEWIGVLDEVHVSAGRRGVEVALAPADLVGVTSATVVALTRAS